MGRRSLLLLTACILLWQGAARAERARPLRLAEGLALLEPFTHPAGHPNTALSHYQRGSYARWTRASWQTLDWEPLVGPDGPINPRFSAAEPLADRCFAHFVGPLRGFPYVEPRGHWFVEAPPNEALSLDDEVLPPWLRRLDVHWAAALVASGGCGRGGACSPGVSFPAGAFAALWEALAPRERATPWWVCRERPVQVMRLGTEQDRFVLLHCDGRVPAEALERLSVLARPVDVPRPERFPALPDPEAEGAEWMPGIRLMRPRLLWVLHRMALEWPWRSIYIFSGYRAPDPTAAPGSHKSRHGEGRALDITVQGVANEDLLALCRKLPDVGCGYYPNNKFVHVDVRPRGSGKALWVDASAPGEPTRYVDSWPGVVEGGAMVWASGDD